MVLDQILLPQGGRFVVSVEKATCYSHPDGGTGVAFTYLMYDAPYEGCCIVDLFTPHSLDSERCRSSQSSLEGISRLLELPAFEMPVYTGKRDALGFKTTPSLAMFTAGRRKFCIELARVNQDLSHESMEIRGYFALDGKPRLGIVA